MVPSHYKQSLTSIGLYGEINESEIKHYFILETDRIVQIDILKSHGLHSLGLGRLHMLYSGNIMCCYLSSLKFPTYFCFIQSYASILLFILPTFM